MRKVAWLHRGVLRKVVQRTETQDQLECGHSVDIPLYSYGRRRHRRCVSCRDQRLGVLLASL